MQIDVSFGCWKALTALLRDENDNYDAVIERLLDVPIEAGAAKNGDAAPRSGASPDAGSGAYFKEVFMPDGTEMRATYKGETYFARISGSKWIDNQTGQARTSPSQAAYSITGRNVNGWLFWIVKRPGDEEWRSLNALRTVKP